ncbi:MAG: hypothetical protein E6G56_05420 [Actinobacteria bacterium]|nr:MAG: hypothetical protein E6G56_05420 [Actinomycetota bacterium]
MVPALLGFGIPAASADPVTLAEHTVLSAASPGWVEVRLPRSPQGDSTHQQSYVRLQGTVALQGVELLSETPNRYWGPGPPHPAASFAFAGYSPNQQNGNIWFADGLPAGDYRLYLFTANGAPARADIELGGFDPGEKSLTPDHPISVDYGSLPNQPTDDPSHRTEAGRSGTLSSLGHLWLLVHYTYPTNPAVGRSWFCQFAAPSPSRGWDGCPGQDGNDLLVEPGGGPNDWVVPTVAHQCPGNYEIGGGASSPTGPPRVQMEGAWISLDAPDSMSPAGIDECGGPKPKGPWPWSDSSSGSHPSSSGPKPARSGAASALAAITATTLNVRRGRVAVPVRCLGPGSCVGRARLGAAGRGAAFAVGAGRTGRVSLRLPNGLRARLASKHRTRTQVALALRTSDGWRQVRRLVRLRLASR